MKLSPPVLGSAPDSPRRVMRLLSLALACSSLGRSGLYLLSATRHQDAFVPRWLTRPTLSGSVSVLPSRLERRCKPPGMIATRSHLLLFLTRGIALSDCEMTGLNPYLPPKDLKAGEDFLPDRILEVRSFVLSFLLSLGPQSFDRKCGARRSLALSRIKTWSRSTRGSSSSSRRKRLSWIA